MGFSQSPEMGPKVGQNWVLGSKSGLKCVKTHFLPTLNPFRGTDKNPFLTHFKGGGNRLLKKALRQPRPGIRVVSYMMGSCATTSINQGSQRTAFEEWKKRVPCSCWLGCFGAPLMLMIAFTGCRAERKTNKRNPLKLLGKRGQTCNGRALDRVTKQKHRPNRQKMSKKCPKIVWAVPPDNFWTFFGHFSDIFRTLCRHSLLLGCPTICQLQGQTWKNLYFTSLNIVKDLWHFLG